MLEKYGPGPRVHYHTGLVAPEEAAADTADGISHQLVVSQERMLDFATEEWGGASHLSGELLDVGCGLGGGCIYYAQRFGAHVTGLTPVPGHVPWIERFARDGDVSHRIRVELGDAHTLAGENRFDAAFSFGASNYFDRAVWFRRLAGLVRLGGHVFIEDTFLVHPSMAAPFNAYWISNIGTRDEYREAAEAAGFELVRLNDVTADAAGFWRLSVDHSRLLLAGARLSATEQAKRVRSIEWQSQFYRAYLRHDVENLLLHFRKRDG